MQPLDCARDASTRICMLSRIIVALGTPDEALTPLNIAIAYGDISRLHIHGYPAHTHD